MKPGDPHVLKLQRSLLNGQTKTVDYNPAVTRRLKELILIEWPRLLSMDELRRRLSVAGVPVQRASINGKSVILYYDTVQVREQARLRLLQLHEEEFLLANHSVN
jgi:hypothetical protein